MLATGPIVWTLGLGLFAIGTIVGSFLNVCIYRIPWQKSVIWPGSHCQNCHHAIAPRDNVPIVAWLLLRGGCRDCGARIAIRYPLVEALVGLLFLALFIIDVANQRTFWGEIQADRLLVWAYHAAFVAFLVAATFIDYDLTIIPDSITITGMVVGIGMGTLFPDIRPEPALRPTHAGGLAVGVIGLLAGGGLTEFCRRSGSLVMGREAMGFGDVTLMAMIGGFLGWQGAVLTFFIGPFFGLAHALWKLAGYIAKRVGGGQLTSTDREIPFGPYLSMAAVTLVLTWQWLWPNWAQPKIFGPLPEVFWELLGAVVR